ncbi:MAG TPA: bifunctional 4-hydroxy-2-oxoglutarate aldolase/2-dehydro-3-deoxy-phosphogluconate aldolase [Verrucomicrobiae bacterium]|nr:bifunctional 4-hydroxy-2-oxoglutarate aldolase/2-dehydro-3-deoxy-phosphogluconate aldolase [Verrucomicrobiae bacterium]
MRTKSDVLKALREPGVIAVVRAPRAELCTPLARALLEGGVIAIEITMTTPNAIEAIRATSQALGSQGLIGVGTVLDAHTANLAIEAGAEFVVSPITRKEIADAAHAHDRPVMLGAYTPTEAQTAHEMGSDFIKIFPADTLGPAYIKALRAPLPHLQIVPTGGVDLNTIGPFLKAGCVAVGAGSSLVPAEALKNEKWDEITRLAKDFVAAAKAARS